MKWIFDSWVKKDAICTALLLEDFHRRLTMRKPPISEINRQIYLRWELEHVNWTVEHWYQILWIDETCINGGRHTRTWVTRRVTEDWNPTFTVERYKRKKEWTFVTRYHEHAKGSDIFWEKDWGTIDKESYQAHTVPVIRGYIQLMRREGIHLVLKRESASRHVAAETSEDLQEWVIIVIYRAPFFHGSESDCDSLARYQELCTR